MDGQVGYDKKALVSFFQSYVGNGEDRGRNNIGVKKMPTHPGGSRATSPAKKDKLDSPNKGRNSRLIRS